MSMALYINNPKADRLARDVAMRNGESITEAVVKALEERLARSPHLPHEEKVRRVQAVIDAAAAFPTPTAFSEADLYGPDGRPA